MRRKGPLILVMCLAAWTAGGSGLVLAATWGNPIHQAVLGMAWGLIVLWVAGCGLAMWRWRDLWRRLAARIRLPWGLQFVLGCTSLALVEEAVATLMTNCAPLFAVQVGQAYITASADYFDVVLYHSVVVFVPMFVGWWVSTVAVFAVFGFHPLRSDGAPG